MSQIMAYCQYLGVPLDLYDGSSRRGLSSSKPVRIKERYVGVRGQIRVALLDQQGAVDHYDEGELEIRLVYSNHLGMYLRELWIK